MSLVSLCIQTLVPFPDQVHQLPCRLHLRSPSLISDLIPDPANVDPRLWAVLVQVYDSLPAFFVSHSLALADTHLPLLQSIPSTPSFSLVTLLDLPSCPHLTDRTILELRFINTLTAFDAAQSSLSSYAIKTLASFTGSWQLRILSLRNCKHITNDAFPHLTKFPLLSVLDLRGTRCNTYNTSLPFQPFSHDLLYYPTPLKSALTSLHALHSDLYSSSNPYFLHINALRYPSTHRPKIPNVTPQNAFFVIPSDSSRIQVGSSHLLEEREKELVHQRNKDAWYQTHDPLESLTNYSPDLAHRPPRRVESSISRITNSSWIGASKHDPPKQVKPRHSFSPPLPKANGTSKHDPPKQIRSRPSLPLALPQANRTSSTSALSFYKLLPKNSFSLVPSRTRSFHDEHLKLYRPAPPWSTLNECLTQVRLEETASMERQERHTRTIPPEHEIARVDMSSTKATLAKRQLDEWALAQAQMHRDEKEKTLHLRVMDAETSLLSRNPFRRQQQQVTKTLKPLIPISTVKVPILTPQVRKSALAREEMESGLNLKRKRIPLEEQEEGDETVKLKDATKSVTRGFNWKGWSKDAS